MIKGAPTDVVEAAALLACSQVVLVNIGVNRPIETRAQWTYFYDEDMCFARLSFPPRSRRRWCRPGCGSIQAEVYFSEKWRPLSNGPEDWIEPTIDGLIECGLVQAATEVVHRASSSRRLPTSSSTTIVRRRWQRCTAILDEIGIGYCGRYGDWAYIWTDQAFNSGERAATERWTG